MEVHDIPTIVQCGQTRAPEAVIMIDNTGGWRSVQSSEFDIDISIGRALNI